MPRHILTADERRRGGITRAAQESMQDARSKGFERTCDTHPYFARKWLKQIIKGTYQGTYRKGSF